MKLSWERNRFELETGSQAEAALARTAGFVLDKSRNLWYSRSAEQAKGFLVDSDTTCKELCRVHDYRIMMSRAEEGWGLAVPRPEYIDPVTKLQIEYLPFQALGTHLTVAAFQRGQRSILIGDEPGLGKTIQAAGVINSLPDLRKILVVCPAMVRNNWTRELTKWLVQPLSIGIAESGYLPPTNIIVINFDILYRNRPFLEQFCWDLIVVDEAHQVKEPTAQRTRALYGYKNPPYTKAKDKLDELTPLQFRYSLDLTGTALVNRPQDLWMLATKCDPQGLGADWEYFGKRYCKMWHAKWGWDSSGASNLLELQNRMRGTFMIRRSKRAVLKLLPPKYRRIIVIPSNNVQGLIDAEKEFYGTNSSAIEAAIEKAEQEQAAGDETSYKAAAKQMSNDGLGEGTLFEKLAKLRKETGVAKIPYIINYAKMKLQEYDKIVVVAHHLDVLNAIYEALGAYGCVMLTGEVDETRRQIAIDSFQLNPGTRVCVLGITLAIGITLTAAHYMLIGELDYREAVVSQAEDREHRIGQLFPVDVDHLVFDNSMDYILVRKIIEKQSISEQALG